MKRLKCYLRTYRRLWGLNQSELSHLLGLRDRSHLALIERGIRPPSPRLMVACETLFGVCARELFPAYCRHVDESLMRRAYVMTQRLERERTETAKQKLALLNEASQRAISSLPPQKA